MTHEEFRSALETKDGLCTELERLKNEVNSLALRVCAGQGSELEYIWSNLANARAYLSTALEASRQLKDSRLSSVDWQI